MWDNVEEDLCEWSERKGDNLYQLVNFYERGVIKLQRLLVELIETSDEPLNCEYKLGGRGGYSYSFS